ncbi:MAG: heme-degrading domain-containing protein [Candidatus Nanopelagicales bacterium]
MSEDLTAADVAAQEAELVLPSLSEDDALDLGALLVARARERALPVAIEVRRAGRVLFRAALPGTSPDNDSWLERKARVVERYGRSTLQVRLSYEERGTTFEAATGLPLSEYAAHGGGFPLSVVGTGVVGFVGVSGLPQREDHAFLVEVLRDYLG